MTKPLSIAVVVGTRPEAIKLMPLIDAARARPDDFTVSVVRTGQHRDMVDRLMHEFGLEADFNLDVMRADQAPAHVLSACVAGLSDHFAGTKPAWVLVQGDTTTTFAGALAAFYNQIAVGHVEAGLRTGSIASPFPEEANRLLTARLAALHFAPTARARQNLLAEGIADRTIVVTGNTGIDALLLTLARPADDEPPVVVPPAGDYLLVTAHRRENHGVALGRICDAVQKLLDRHPGLVAWIPMHPSPPVRTMLADRLGADERIYLTEPLGYRAFARALEGASLVLTDSGGVQEECAALGRPVLVMREETERPEGVDAGVSVIVGTDVHCIVDVGSRLLGDPAAYRRMARRCDAYGAGHATVRILDALLREERRRSPDAARSHPVAVKVVGGR